MYNYKCFSLLKATMIFVIGSALTACATNSKSSSDLASNKNSVPASACVGNAYLQKYGCSLSRINKAAENGDPDAQYALGYMYYYGVGTVRDKQTAELWIKRAAAQGQPLAKKAEVLISNGQHFQHLHRRGSSSGGSYQSGGGSDGGSSSRSGGSTKGIKYAPAKSVETMNNSTPDKPLNQVLPNYNKAPDEKSKSVIKSLQKKTDDAPVTDSSGKVEPITMNQPHKPSPIQSAARYAMTDAEARMMAVPKQHYTLQLMSGRNLAAINEFVRSHNLQDKAMFYSAQLNHENWYMLVYGDYSSIADAQMAARDLPESMRQLHPWVKSYRIVQDEIRQRRLVT